MSLIVDNGGIVDHISGHTILAVFGLDEAINKKKEETPESSIADPPIDTDDPVTIECGLESEDQEKMRESNHKDSPRRRPSAPGILSACVASLAISQFLDAVRVVLREDAGENFPLRDHVANI